MHKFCLLILCFLCSCKHTQEPTRFEGCAMTIPYCIQVGDPLTKKQNERIQGIILEIISQIHAVYNNWNPDSEISQLKKLPAYQPFQISEPLAQFLTFVGQIVERTEGRFDPTVDPLQHIWKKNLQNGVLPEQSILDSLIQATGWDHVHLEGKTFWKDEALTSLDLGAVAKGYAVDLMTEALQAEGFTSLYIEWGGEIRTVGKHPHHRPWTVGIEGLFPIPLENESIATSGTYIQNWSVDGISYTHIIDPRTCRPLQNCPITSVSVIAPTCAEADALATALMLFPSPEEARSWASIQGIRAFIW